MSGHTFYHRHRKTTKNICKTRKKKIRTLKINTNRVYADYTGKDLEIWLNIRAQLRWGIKCVETVFWLDLDAEHGYESWNRWVYKDRRDAEVGVGQTI